MRAFYCKSIPEEGFAEISEAEERHLFASLRKHDGDMLWLLDGNGVLAKAVLEAGKPKVLERRLVQPPTARLHLFFSPPHKRDKLDLIISQSVELGVSSITPILAKNSVSRPSEISDRWKMRIIEAGKQSLNPFFPQIGEIQKLDDAIKTIRSKAYQGFFGSCAGQSSETGLASNEAAWIVGPEGGFDQEEIEMMTASGMLPIRIGGSFLRIETACAAGIAVLRERLQRSQKNIDVQ